MWSLLLSITAIGDSNIYLEFPLRRHHLGVGPRDLHAGIEAGSVVSLDDLAADHLIGADAAVIGALRTGEAVLRPTKRPAIEIQESVLLLDAEPGILVLDGFHRLVRNASLVRLRRRLVAVVGVAEHEFVFTATEGIIINGYWIKIYVTVGAVSLICRATIVSPRWQF